MSRASEKLAVVWWCASALGLLRAAGATALFEEGCGACLRGTANLCVSSHRRRVSAISVEVHLYEQLAHAKSTFSRQSSKGSGLWAMRIGTQVPFSILTCGFRKSSF